MSGQKHLYAKNENGFTLLEIALVLIISGMFMMAGAEFLKAYTKTAKYETTIENADEVQDVLYEYYVREGHYPCPANPSLGPLDPDYGTEECRNFADQASYDANRDNCNGIPAGIECPDPATNGARDVDGDGVSDVVVIGAFPFRSMAQYLDNIDGEIKTTTFREVNKKDGYGQLYSYAVTESMTGTNPANTVTSPARPYDGAIVIEDENGISLTEPNGAAHYVLLSHGENGRGGSTDRGQLVDDCTIMDLITDPNNPVPMDSPVPSPDPGLGGGLDLELENCNFGNAVFVKGVRSTRDNSDYYDDLVFFKVSESMPVWQISLNDSESIYNTNEGSAGVGTGNAAPEEKLHVIGNVLGEGAIIADEYCDGHSNTCFHAAALGGEGSDCPDGHAAYGISEGRLLCVEVPWTVPSVDCPLDNNGDQTYLHAISNTGRITCCTEDGSASLGNNPATECQDYQ